MAKKRQEIVLQEEPQTIVLEESEPLFESDAYGSPQPEAGSDVTVMKQVGIGGPVPIVAPKHNTIQLQPIVVPLAVVPYMTQDSNVLRTDSRAAGGYEGADDGYREATEFTTVERERTAKKKRKGSLPRIFSLVTFVLTALAVLPYFLSEVTAAIGNMSIECFNVIAIIKGWIAGGFNLSGDGAINLVYVIVMGITGVQVILSALGIVIGKYPKPIAPILSFLDGAAFIGLLVYEIVAGGFIASDESGLIVLLALGVLNFITSLVFSIVLNRKEDEEEQKSKRVSEI